VRRGRNYQLFITLLRSQILYFWNLAFLIPRHVKVGNVTIAAVVMIGHTGNVADDYGWQKIRLL
jgi:hypothetical protein